MVHIESPRLRRFTWLAAVTVSGCLFGCGSDDNHGPTIGAPQGPTPVVVEGGGAESIGGNGNLGGEASLAGGVNQGGALSNGGDTFGTGGTGTDPFGTGGTGTAPFGTGGTF